MKDIVLPVVLMLMLFSLLSGCQKSDTNEVQPTTQDTPTASASVSPTPAAIEPPLPAIQTSSVLKDKITTCYSLFPIAYADSNGDGIGDINGIIQKLDYLKYDLGVDCVWINPVHPSPSYHKYDVTDYYSIDEAFGTLEDYENLIAEMHERDMYIVMDLVINHTSTEHPWFQAAIAGDTKYKDYYTWKTAEDMGNHHTKEGWHQIDDWYYYGGFSEGMPELNFENPSVREEIQNIAEYWLNKGVDGFRIDAARHIYDKNEYPNDFDVTASNISYFNEFSQFIKSIDKDAFIVSEVNTNFKSASAYYEGMEALFNFDIGEVLVGAAFVGYTDLADTINYYLEQISMYDDKIMGTFLSNHDQNRYIESLGRSTTRAKVAVNLLFTLPGTPFVYYGEEIGMIGKKPDENIREPFLWGDDSSYNTDWNLQSNNVNINTIPLDEQITDENSLFYTYKNMIRIRKENPVLKYGDIEAVQTGAKVIIAYRRFDENSNLLIIHNTLEQSVTMNITPGIDYNIIYAQYAETNITDGVVTLSGRSVIIIDIGDNTDVTLDNIEVAE